MHRLIDVFKPVVAVAVGAVMAASVAMAAEVKGFGNEMSTSDIIRALTPPPKTRGLRPANQKAVQPSLDFSVEFEFDSAALTPEARRALANLGDALASAQLQSQVFLIEGHTDAVGSGAYNQSLSERRAASVQRFLSSRKGISGDRLRSVGKGESDLLDQENPASGVNRRVRIINVGG